VCLSVCLPVVFRSERVCTSYLQFPDFTSVPLSGEVWILSVIFTATLSFAPKCDCLFLGLLPPVSGLCFASSLFRSGPQVALGSAGIVLLLPVHHRSTATWNLVLFPDPFFHLCVLDLLVGLRSSQHWHSTLRFGLVPSGIALLLACCAPTILPAVSFLPRLTLLGLLLVVSVASVCAKSKPCHLILPPPAFVLRSKLHSLVPI
jgi:hypothetical protein